jgi:hypothetical protein
MEWRTDWLYALIFAEVRRVWYRAQRDAASGGGAPGSPPALFVISEYERGDTAKARCFAPALRRWHFRGGEDFGLVEGDAAAPGGRAQGMFYDVGRVGFFVAEDRRRVVFEYLLGPRYGGGRLLAVEGEGRSARLAPSADGAEWRA